MKRKLVFLSLATTAVVFSYCSSAKKTATTTATIPAPKDYMVAGATGQFNYQDNVTPLLLKKCAPCHYPSLGGKVESFEDMGIVTSHIDKIIKRISLEPGARGFMPAGLPKLPQGEIDLLKSWKESGLK